MAWICKVAPSLRSDLLLFIGVFVCFAWNSKKVCAFSLSSSRFHFLITLGSNNKMDYWKSLKEKTVYLFLGTKCRICHNSYYQYNFRQCDLCHQPCCVKCIDTYFNNTTLQSCDSCENTINPDALLYRKKYKQVNKANWFLVYLQCFVVVFVFVLVSA